LKQKTAYSVLGFEPETEDLLDVEFVWAGSSRIAQEMIAIAKWGKRRSCAYSENEAPLFGLAWKTGTKFHRELLEDEGEICGYRTYALELAPLLQAGGIGPRVCPTFVRLSSRASVLFV